MSDATVALLGVAGGAIGANLLSIPFWLWWNRREERRWRP